MPFKSFKLLVKSKEIVSPNIILLRTVPDCEVSFLAGQYFSFKIDDKINRSYSTSSAPGESSIDFLIDITPGGAGSIFIMNLKEEEWFNVMGPFGFFTLEKTKALENEYPLTFIATGTGIAPVRSMVYHLLRNLHTTKKITLLFGLRHDNETYLYEDFFQLQSEFPNFEFIPVISQPSEQWHGEIGHCQDILRKRTINMNTQFYLCGRTENVKAIARDLVQFGYPPEKVFFEKFG